MTECRPLVDDLQSETGRGNGDTSAAFPGAAAASAQDVLERADEALSIANMGSILVVDDIAANLQVLTGMLQDRGYEARSVPSGKLALQAARRDPPDLILLDINMPGMNGYEVCERLKANEQLKGIPVIFISGLTEPLDKVKAFTIGGGG